MRSQLRWIVFGVIVGCLFMWLALRGTDFTAVINSLSRTESTPVIWVVVFATLFMFAKAIRWQIILSPAGNPSFKSLVSAIYIGTAANLVVAHLGEVARSALVGRKEAIPSSAVLASVGIERVFDLITVATLLAAVLIFDNRLHDATVAAGFIAVGGVVIALTLMVILMRPSRLRAWLAEVLDRILPAVVMNYITHHLKRSLIGLAVLDSPWLLLRIFLLSLLQWGFIIAAVWFCALAVGQEITITMAITVWVLMVVGLTLPSSPAQLGTVQLAFTLGLVLSQTQSEVAFAASIVYTVGVNLTYMVLGLGCWLIFGRWHLQRAPSVASWEPADLTQNPPK